MSCKFCDKDNTDFGLLNETMEYSGIEIAMLFKGMLRARYYPTLSYEDLFENQDIVNINFCPICGRSLKALQ